MPNLKFFTAHMKDVMLVSVVIHFLHNTRRKRQDSKGLFMSPVERLNVFISFPL
jgi:hypothetical protein